MSAASRSGRLAGACAIALLCALAPARADPARVDAVETRQAADGTWRFDVTISHGDTGWEHYADAWRVLDMNGREIERRDLAHPHVEEQPFTRSLSGVRIPGGATHVQIQARETPGGWSPETTTVPLR